MSTHLTEEEQVEALKSWWKDNGRSVVAGLVLGLGGVFGWQAWNQHQQSVAQQASYQFEQLSQAMAAGSAESAQKQAEKLVAERPGSIYAVFAALNQARLYLEQADPAAARIQLEWVLANTGDPSFRQIARLRLARLLLTQKELDAAASVVKQAEADSFSGEFALVRGDIAWAKRQYEEARQAYKEALAGNVGSAALVQMKLDDIENL